MKPLVLAKLDSPSVSGCLDIHRLIERYKGIRRVPLTLVTAAAGSGKSTSLAIWASKQTDPVAWYSIDEYDDSPPRFFKYLLAALQRSGVINPEEAPELPLEATADFFEAIMFELANLFARSEAHCYVVLDDYHLVHDAGIHQAVSFLARNSGARLHLVLASRSDPPLSVATFRAKGMLLEIRGEDLHFTLEETAHYLKNRGLAALSEDAVRSLHRKTEGWIAGLQLSGLVLAGAGNPERAAEEFAGTHRYILDYLVDEVLTREPPDNREFLLKTSPLEELTPEVCDYLLGRSDSAARLEELVERNLLLHRVGGQGRAYRYHGLMADVLRKLLQREQPGAYCESCRDVAAYFRRMGAPKEAVEYALRAGDPEQAAETLDAFLEELLDGGDFGLIMSFLYRIPEELRSRRPHVSILTALFLLLNGDPEGKTSTWLENAEKHDRSGAVAHLVVATRLVIETVREVKAETPGRLKASITQLHKEDSFFERFLRRTMVMLYVAVNGDVDFGIPALSQSYVAAMDRGDAIGAALTALDLVNAQVAAGLLEDAERLCTSYLDLLGYADGRRSASVGLLLIGLGLVLHERNRLMEAKSALSEGETLCQSIKLAGALDACLGLSRTFAAGKEFSSARNAVARAREITEGSTVMSDDVRYVAAHGAAVELAAGNMAEVESWFTGRFGDRAGFLEATRSGVAERQDYLLFLELEIMVGSRYLVYSGSGAAADEPLRMLEERLRTTGREARLAEAIAIRAILWKRMADTDGALAIMREALAIGERTGLQRTFLDLGDEAIALIEGIAGQPEHQRYAGLLLEAIENAEGSTAVERGGTASGEPALLSSPAASAIPVTFPSTPALAPSMGDQPRLSAREAEVLNLIAQGKSNKEIGAEIFVSLATVKWHSARIYEKLQVRNRTEAVARARQLGILR